MTRCAVRVQHVVDRALHVVGKVGQGRYREGTVGSPAVEMANRVGSLRDKTRGRDARGCHSEAGVSSCGTLLFHWKSLQSIKAATAVMYEQGVDGVTV